MSTPISIVITSYNRAQYLPIAIESVLAQTYSNFDLLIWDDGSTDHSVEIAQQYSQKDQRIQVVAAKHKGLSLP
jgi:glycosyltransferase involved in cell wall biosynthesis